MYRSLDLSEGGETSEHFLLPHISQDCSVNFMLNSRNVVITAKVVNTSVFLKSYKPFLGVVIEFPKPLQVVLTIEVHIC